ncbi:MAG TPA: methyltransferase domain-containing protein [Polyangiaceae bacterium]
MSWQETWVTRFYGSRPGWTDGTTEFHELCRARAGRGGKILEVGAGPTNATSAFLATLGELHGLDVSDEVHGNADLTSSGVIEGDRYPFGDATFDLVVSNYVVEHVQDAAAHLAEIARVLRDGGCYVFRTPNLVHYVALVSRLAPHSAHRRFANRLRELPAGHHEPWPTVYAMNTPASVRRHAAQAGFDVDRLDLVEKEPSYGMVARPLFLAFMAYERLVNASGWLAPFRANMFVVLRKRPPALAAGGEVVYGSSA